ncbi:MAG: hypothetical protein ACI3X1_07440 [Eubacteriales bacterium]
MKKVSLLPPCTPHLFQKLSEKNSLLLSAPPTSFRCFLKKFLSSPLHPPPLSKTLNKKTVKFTKLCRLRFEVPFA